MVSEARGFWNTAGEVAEPSDADDSDALVRLGIGKAKSAPHGVTGAEIGAASRS